MQIGQWTLMRPLREEEGNIAVCTVFCSIRSVASAFLFIIKVESTFSFQRAFLHAPIKKKKKVYTLVEKMSHNIFGEKDYLMQISAKCVFCQLEMSKVAVIFFINVK